MVVQNIYRLYLQYKIMEQHSLSSLTVTFPQKHPRNRTI